MARTIFGGVPLGTGHGHGLVTCWIILTGETIKLGKKWLTVHDISLPRAPRRSENVDAEAVEVRVNEVAHESISICVFGQAYALTMKRHHHQHFRKSRDPKKRSYRGISAALTTSTASQRAV